MIPSIRYTMLLAGVLVTAPVGMSTVHADSVVVYPVQSGLVNDASCCSPYAYSNSTSATFSLTGCFSDPHYGCWNDRERGAWRWDLENALPETAVVTSAHVHWNHPTQCLSLIHI